MNKEIKENLVFPSCKVHKYAMVFQVLEAMKGSTSTRPAIFAMSNPTKNGTPSFCRNKLCSNMY